MIELKLNDFKKGDEGVKPDSIPMREETWGKLSQLNGFFTLLHGPHSKVTKAQVFDFCINFTHKSIIEGGVAKKELAKILK